MRKNKKLVDFKKRKNLSLFKKSVYLAFVTYKKKKHDIFFFCNNLKKRMFLNKPVRLVNRCIITGRPKAVFKKYGLARHVLKTNINLGFIYGMAKRSW